MVKEKKLVVSSTAFAHNKKIPEKYSCHGEDVNPPLEIKGIPKEAKSLVLIVDDPDAPMGVWDHWVVWNIPPTGRIEENTVPGKEGVNSASMRAWHGPCPPSGTHHYHFKVYALNAMLDLNNYSKKGDVEKAMKGQIIAKGKLVGLFSN